MKIFTLITVFFLLTAAISAQHTGYLITIEKEGHITPFRTTSVALADSIITQYFPGLKTAVVLEKSVFAELRSENVIVYIEKKALKHTHKGKTRFIKLKNSKN